MKNNNKAFKTFDELFEAALLYDETIEKPQNEWHKGTMKSYYSHQFNTWLLNSGWNGSDENEYKKNLTKENWRMFLKAETQFKKELRKAFEDKKLTWKLIEKMTIQQKIVFFKEVKHCIPFQALHNTVITVCDFVKPLYPDINPYKYIEYFLSEIDFEKLSPQNFGEIDNEPTKEETIKYCNAIYYGLEQVLKVDINKVIHGYQKGVKQLTVEEISATQIKLIEIIGDIKRQARNTEPGISFTERYNKLYKSIEAKESLSSIDYQYLIFSFNETILNDLLSSYEIINETFNSIKPVLIAETPQLIPTNVEIKKEGKDYEKILTEIRNSDNEFWRGLPMEEVIKHFEVMTKRKSKNGNLFLTNEQLVSFLKKGFLNDRTQKKQKINCSNGEKGFVIKRFYELYDLAVGKYSYPARKAKFIKLFTDCFDNWEEKTIESFFKSNKAKEKW